MNNIITIDGPAGAGKSTIARELAARLNLPYLDTGAMFRFLAMRLGPDALRKSPQELQAQALENNFELRGAGDDTILLANGQPLGDELRADAVSALASSLAQSPVIREILRSAQRRLASSTSLVAEGRDLGTVVFPDAACKFFLDASPEVRVRRRWRQLAQKGDNPDLAAITANILARDKQDRERAQAPLKAAADALVIDTSQLEIKDVVERMLGHVRERAAF